MSVAFDSSLLLTVFLVATRIAGVLAMSPVLGFSFIPARVRLVVVLMLAMTFAMVPGVSAAAQQIISPGQLMMAFVTELILGAALGFAVQTIFAALSFAGQLADIQIGFGAAVLFDPNTQAQSPLLSVLLTMSGAMLFLTFDAHHELLRAIAASLQAVPPGHFMLDLDGGIFVRQFGTVFVYGFIIAAPVVLGLMLADTAIAVVARTMPQVNVYFVTLPMKIFLGLSLLALSMGYIGPLMRKIFDQALGFAAQVAG